VQKIDELIPLGEPERSKELRALKDIFDQASMSTVCDKEEIKWPVFRWRLNFLNILKTLLPRRRS